MSSTSSSSSKSTSFIFQSPIIEEKDPRKEEGDVSAHAGDYSAHDARSHSSSSNRRYCTHKRGHGAEKKPNRAELSFFSFSLPFQFSLMRIRVRVTPAFGIREGIDPTLTRGGISSLGSNALPPGGNAGSAFTVPKVFLPLAGILGRP